MVDIINSVAACLDSIQIQENMIFKADESTPKDQIIMRLNAFKDLLSRKQAQINQLTGNNKSNKLAMANFQKMVDFLQQQLGADRPHCTTCPNVALTSSPSLCVCT
jgi:hypothetical protein